MALVTRALGPEFVLDSRTYGSPKRSARTGGGTASGPRNRLLRIIERVVAHRDHEREGWHTAVLASRPMRVLILAQCYAPEEVGPAIWVKQLADTLQCFGHEVIVLTEFPNYPECVVFPGYRGRLVMAQSMDGVRVIRCWSYAGGRARIVLRLLNFATFCASALLVGIIAVPRVDVVYTIIPPLPLGITGWALARTRRAAHVVNVQDIYPQAAVSLGILRNGVLIRFFEWVERFVYRQAQRIVVIADSFRENIIGKGVAPSTIDVVPNWADANAFPAFEGDNAFRQTLRRPGDFVVLHSGGLTLNSSVQDLLEAAALLACLPVSIVIVGDGPRKQALVDRAQILKVTNVEFRPFQPLARYAETLASADLTVVTLNVQASLVSVPSKIYKQMAAGRAILAIAPRDSELSRLVTSAGCGFVVEPGDPAGIVDAVRWALEHRSEAHAMGRRAREYLRAHYDRTIAVNRIATSLHAGIVARQAVGHC